MQAMSCCDALLHSAWKRIRLRRTILDKSHLHSHHHYPLRLDDTRIALRRSQPRHRILAAIDRRAGRHADHTASLRLRAFLPRLFDGARRSQPAHARVDLLSCLATSLIEKTSRLHI